MDWKDMKKIHDGYFLWKGGWRMEKRWEKKGNFSFIFIVLFILFKNLKQEMQNVNI